MVNWSIEGPYWTALQDCATGVTLVKMVQRGWHVTKARRLPHEGEQVYWSVELRWCKRVVSLIVLDGPVVRSYGAGISGPTPEAA